MHDFPVFHDLFTWSRTGSLVNLWDHATQLIGDIHRFRRNSDSFWASSPWFATTGCTPEELRPLSWSVCFPQPKKGTRTSFSSTSRLQTLVLCDTWCAPIWRPLRIVSRDWKRSILCCYLFTNSNDKFAEIVIELWRWNLFYFLRFLFTRCQEFL